MKAFRGFVYKNFDYKLENVCCKTKQRAYPMDKFYELEDKPIYSCCILLILESDWVLDAYR